MIINNNNNNNNNDNKQINNMRASDKLFIMMGWTGWWSDYFIN